MSNFVRIMCVSILLLSLLVMFSGCAGNIALTKENKSSLKEVSVSQQVSNPARITVIGIREFALSGLGGIGGAVVATELAKSPEAALKAVMEKEGIDPGQIFREQFINQLKNCGLSCAIVDQGGDAEFKLSIAYATFMKPPGFTHNLKLQISMKASLVKPDGSILWKDSERVTTMASGTPSHSFKDYVTEPELIREAFTVCSKIVAEKLVNNLIGK
jgi:hypothetical protein